MSAETKERDLQEIGRTAYESIAEMVAALECDYDRLEHLRQLRQPGPVDLGDEDNEMDQDTLFRELAELEAAAGDCESRDDAEQRIQEDPLSLEVRTGWITLGSPVDANELAEFNILLCTGGPAVRIVGELRGGEPYRARLEVQDWFTPWTEYTGGYGESPVSETLLTYARCFYFGQ